MSGESTGRSYVPSLSIQWHITTACQNRCRHCYMFDEATYENERKRTLRLPDLTRILDSIQEFERRRSCRISRIAVSGGDPLLHPDWEGFFQLLRDRGKSISVMGNPESLTSENLQRLADFEVRTFQVSLDGLERTHDYFRRGGSFRRTVDALEKLSTTGVSTNVMFSLFRENADQLVPLLRFVCKETPANSFSFDIGCPTGNGKSLLTPVSREEASCLLQEYHAEKRKLELDGETTRIAERSNVFAGIRFATGLFAPVDASGVSVVGGCLAGWHGASILSDGEVLACRRMGIAYGKMPEASFESIFLESLGFRRLRRLSSYTGCQGCSLIKYCRGCPAFTASDEPGLGPYPLCPVDRGECVSSEHSDEPPIDCSNEEEMEILRRAIFLTVGDRIAERLKSHEFSRVYLNLALDPSERRQFAHAPTSYLAAEGSLLNAEDAALLGFIVGAEADSKHQLRGEAGRVSALALGATIDALL